ncbi:hypothetical protein B0J14DRAFT_194024 [Halenospora varia]|nr:hypothetical protein B0J14DRAFT_194024 [Halenospora varia]
MQTRPRRCFKEVDVSTLSVQRRDDRFPFASGQHVKYPHCARWRMNLTALSQRYNLYFAAYRNKLHVSIPEGRGQTIPSRPNLKVKLPVSAEALRIGGHIDHDHPHCVNHLIVGNIGQHEIILLATDDGDVLVYYTHLFQAEIKSDLGLARSSKSSGTRPLLHENVGSSAWGLAIHEQSRLVAVSSNLREITVFGFAIHKPDEFEDNGDVDLNNLHSESPPLLELESASASKKDSPLSKLEEEASTKSDIFPGLTKRPTSALDSRKTGYRITVPLGLRGHNIPTIDFASNLEGEAEMILAGDILGNLWRFSIWTGRSYEPLEVVGMIDEDAHQMSWGVKILPLSYFQVVSTPLKAYGMTNLELGMKFSGSEDYCPNLIDITDSTSLTKYSMIRRIPPSLTLDETDDSKLALMKRKSTTANYARELQRNPKNHPCYSLWREYYFFGTNLGGTPGEDSLLNEYMEPFRALVNLPMSRGDPPTSNDWESLSSLTSTLQQRKREHMLEPTLHSTALKRASQKNLPGDVAILRTYNHDIELIPPAKGIPRTLCSIDLPPPQWRVAPDMRVISRFNLLAVIPELSLAIVASQGGFAVLISLTRLEDNYSQFGPVVMFRVEQFLPLSDHEPRLTSPFLGIAVSPLPLKTGDDSDAYMQRRRWRVLLQYANLSIFSYELSRGGNDELLVF